MALKSTLSILRKLWRALQSPQLLFYALPYFMLVLIAGTVAQKYIGLFSATHQFFNSFILWVGSIPLPAGASVLALLFVNLGAHFISKSQWNRTQIGTSIAHLSILVLLFGGAMTLATKKEGFMILRPNDTVRNVYDYHQREFVIEQNGNIILETDPETFSEYQQDITIKAVKLCKNCILGDDKKLRDLPARLEDELNQWGMEIRVDGKTIILSEFQGNRYETKLDGKSFAFSLRRKRFELPFTLLLKNFKQDYYQGTDIASHYESELLVSENKQQWPTLVSMNNPFRYRGYTFYQSSLLALPGSETASVLNVVKNDGWLFPYIATGLLCLGLVLHLAGRRYGRK